MSSQSAVSPKISAGILRAQLLPRRLGRGGGISGLCLAMSIPLASAGVFESSALIDKYLTKILMKGLGVPTVEYLYLRDMGGATHVKDFPVMVKPARLGSSIGVVKADNSAQLKGALEAAFALDTAVLVERYISDRREINCAAYFADGKIVTSPCEEVFGGDILSYDDKYSGSGKGFSPRISRSNSRNISVPSRQRFIPPCVCAA